MPDSIKDIALSTGPALEMAKVLREQAKLTGAQQAGKALSGEKGGKSGSQYDEKTLQAAKDFEAMLLQQMFKSMWHTVPKSDLLSGSKEEEIYRDMLNEALAKDVAEKQSIGIKDVIIGELAQGRKR